MLKRKGDPALDVYLDNAATTPALPEVASAVADALVRRFGNPSSLHRWGIAADAAVGEARRAIADALGAGPDEVVFTSGGTESNNLAVGGLAAARRRAGRRAVTTAIEHSSLLGALDALDGWEIVRLPVDGAGLVAPQAVAEAAAGAALVAIGHVNNEVGTVQPLAAIGAAIRRLDPRPAFHVDAVQSFGKVPLRPREWGVDTCALSAHKIHGPKGVGALWVRRGIRLLPQLHGGDQQGGLRPGTENVPGIAGFGAAVRLLAADPEAPGRMAALRERLWAAISPVAVRNGPPPEAAAPHILNVHVPGLPAEVLLHALEERGVACSAGSACLSRRPEPSHVLLALGMPEAAVKSSIRLSLSRLTTAEEIDAAGAAIVEAVGALRRLVRR
jgi:cysteine desulfurase